MVGDAGLREVVSADPLAALAGPDLAAPFRGDRRLLLFLGALEEPRLEHAHGLRTVLDLRALVLARHDETARQVGDPYRRVGRVDTLAAGARGPVDVDPEILLLDLHVDVLGLRQHRDRDGRGVDAAGGFGDGHALHPMDAALELQPAPGAAAVDEQDHVLEPADTGRAGVHHLDPPALALGVLRVHAGEIRREQRRLVAAGAGANLHEDVPLVVRVARQQEPLQLLLERRLPGGEVVDLRLRQLGELAVAALGQDVAGLADAAEHLAVGREALDDLHGIGMLLPEAGVLGRQAEDRRVRQEAGDLVRPLFDLAELVKQHRASAPLRRRWPRWTNKNRRESRRRRLPSASYEVVVVWRLYFRWKRSTRPAVSMSLCLPV